MIQSIYNLIYPLITSGAEGTLLTTATTVCEVFAVACNVLLLALPFVVIYRVIRALLP